MQGCLRLFGMAVTGVSPATRKPSAAPNAANAVHHNDMASIGSVQREVHAMQSHLRQVVTASLMKDGETRASALAWMAAILAANELTLKGLKSRDPHVAMQASAKRSGDAALVNLAAVLLQLCEPFLEPGSVRTGKGHDGYARLDPAWFDRELSRRLPHPPAAAALRSHKLRRSLADAASSSASAGAAATSAAGAGAGNTSSSGANGENDDEDAEALAAAIKMSLSAAPATEAATTWGAPGQWLSPPPRPSVPSSVDFHFVTECFFLALGAVHVGLLPALENTQKLADDMHRKARVPPLPPDASASQYAHSLQQIQAAEARAAADDRSRVQVLRRHRAAAADAWPLRRPHLRMAHPPRRPARRRVHCGLNEVDQRPVVGDRRPDAPDAGKPPPETRR